jgi:hypothetical protein
MELDELKLIWAEQDRKIEAGLRLNHLLLTATHLKDARSAMGRHTAALILQALIWLAIIMPLGGFLYANLSATRVFLCGVAVDAYAIGMLATTIRQIVAVRAIDYTGPVTRIQGQLTALRALRIRITCRALLAGVILWAPFSVVVCRVLFGADLANAAWLWANLASGVAVVPVSIWAARRFSDRASRSPSFQRLMRDIAGGSLDDAARVLAEIASFESDAA